jgi:hypothetical protein
VRSDAPLRSIRLCPCSAFGLKLTLPSISETECSNTRTRRWCGADSEVDGDLSRSVDFTRGPRPDRVRPKSRNRYWCRRRCQRSPAGLDSFHINEPEQAAAHDRSQIDVHPPATLDSDADRKRSVFSELFVPAYQGSHRRPNSTTCSTRSCGPPPTRRLSQVPARSFEGESKEVAPM